MTPKQVGILIFNDVEVLDFCGPFEVFSVTRLDPQNRQAESPFEVSLIAEQLIPITTRGGMRVEPHRTTATCGPLDILVIPGGQGTRREIKNDTLLEWIAQRAREVETLTSVCTGSLLLGRAGLLDGRNATTHFNSLDWLRESCPNVNVIADQHVVVDGNIYTSAGISAGIDMALKVVVHHCGEPIARDTARWMEYPFPDENRRRV